MIFKRFLFLAIIGLFLIVDTQAQFSIEAQYRPRFEFRDGYRKLPEFGSVSSIIMSQRTRLSLNYKSKNLKIKFTPQDVRIWGDEQLSSSTGVYGDDSSLDLFETYAEIKTGDFGWISVGRQQLVYDRERLLAARNWNQNGISYDAIVLKFCVYQWNIHAGSSWNSLNATLSDNFYLPDRIKSLNFLWINRNFNSKLNLSFLHIASGVTETDSTNILHFRQTTGIYVDYNNNNLKLRGNVYYQYGKNKTGKNINAFLFDTDIAYKIGKFTPGLGLSYLSGNKNPEEKTDHLFNILYGARHKYFGHMDYFRDFENHTKQGGLCDVYTYVEYKFSNTISLTNIAHYFQLAQINSLTENDKNLGFENEILLKYKIDKNISIKSGYVFFVPTETLKCLQEVPDSKFSQFFYLELTIKPTIFKQKTEN